MGWVKERMEGDKFANKFKTLSSDHIEKRHYFPNHAVKFVVPESAPTMPCMKPGCSAAVSARAQDLTVWTDCAVSLLYPVSLPACFDYGSNGPDPNSLPSLIHL